MACCQAGAPHLPAAQALELADIFRRFGDELPLLSSEQRKAVRDIISCRTEELGGHIYQCDHCGHLQQLYNACRNRNCPKCQNLDQARWQQSRQQELLPVQYFHVVFTIPDELKAIFLANKTACYNLLFAAVAETLKQVALNPDHLGARIGFMAVLHSWTQTLLFHPHLHCIVPGGGLNSTNDQWVSAKPGFLLPVQVLSLVFRGKLLDKLQQAASQGKIGLAGANLDTLLQQAARHSWVVYCKPPFAGPQQVLRYLSRYTNQIAIGNRRLVALDGRQVIFRYKDRADSGKTKLMSLDAAEFLRRFLLHVVPNGLVRIRYYGLLANGVKKDNLALCRQLLSVTDESVEPGPGDDTWQELLLRLTGFDATLCPSCRVGRMKPKHQLIALRTPWSLRSRATSP